MYRKPIASGGFVGCYGKDTYNLMAELFEA